MGNVGIFVCSTKINSLRPAKVFPSLRHTNWVSRWPMRISDRPLLKPCEYSRTSLGRNTVLHCHDAIHLTSLKAPVIPTDERRNPRLVWIHREGSLWHFLRSTFFFLLSFSLIRSRSRCENGTNADWLVAPKTGSNFSREIHGNRKRSRNRSLITWTIRSRKGNAVQKRKVKKLPQKNVFSNFY